MIIGLLTIDPAGRLGLQIPLFRAPAACWYAGATVESTTVVPMIHQARGGSPTASWSCCLQPVP